MSSPLGIAGVTQILRDLLNDGLIDHDVTSAIGSNVTVRAQPPDRLADAGGVGEPLVNLFLHRVSPNPGWANVDLPRRDTAGRRLAEPPLALDLHYLVSAFGPDDLHGEILLGHAMEILHAHPVVGRGEIRRALEPAPTVSGALPPALTALADTGLADQIEQLKVTPEPTSVDELSKLWTATQTGLRPSAAYVVTVVLIRREAPRRRARPVLTIGPDDAGVTARPELAPPLPAITGVVPPAGQPSVRLGDTLVIEGRHLDGLGVEAVFTQPRSSTTNVVPVGADPTARRVEVTLPNAPADWAAGPMTVELRLQKAGEPVPRRTNPWPVLLAPVAALPPSAITRGADGGVTVTLAVAPELRPGQVVSLAVGDAEAPAAPLAGQGATASFAFPALPAGDHPVQLRVDGVESWLVVRSAPPRFDPAQRLTVPA
mgnify:CR=1 FL=1